MAPNGGPSMTSQARAAELNAAAAARARILNGYRNGELSEVSTRTYTSLTGPRTTPSQVPSSHTNNTEHVVVESFRRPNRPVSHYYPPVSTTAAPIPVYTYPQSQYADPRAIPAAYAPAHYPVATEYYQPMYQPMQSYPQMYPSYLSGYLPPASPLHRGAIAAMTRQNTSRSATASPTKSGPPQLVQVSATPPAKPPRFPSPSKSLSRGPSRGPSRSPPKSPVKKSRATPSPKKPPVEVLRYFTPDDLSPPKVEVKLKLFKAELEKIENDEKSKDNAEDKSSPEKSPAKSANEHEGDKSKEPEVDEDEELTPRAKQPESSNVVRASSINHQLAMEAHREARRQPPTLEDSPLTQKAYRKSMVEMLRPFSFLPPGFMPRSDVKDNLSAANQKQTLRVEETHHKKHDQSIYQDDGLFYVAQRTDEANGEGTPDAVPRRLQSPFQLRPRSPMTYYKPIVNKYPRDVFASWQSRLEELWKVENDNSCLAFRQQPGVKGLPGPFKGFPRFPLIDENAQRPMNTGVLMPPPGFTVPGPILLPCSAHWNPESSPSNRAKTYYDRVLEAEDWFHQSILKQREPSSKFQKKLTEVQSMIFIDLDPFKDLPPPARDIKGAQVTELIKRISETLISYTNRAENEKRGFDFGDTELFLDAETGLRLPKRHRRKNRRSRRKRYRGVEFDIAPGCELFDGGVLGSNFIDCSTFANSIELADSSDLYDGSDLSDSSDS
ncbi:hypothetical protein ZTR_01475 [Talaromyces verruculosus]|nr:hypothetical protein ZTR_01475 [Talaromyces verruculosus]